MGNAEVSAANQPEPEPGIEAHYRPMVSEERAARMRRWHEHAYEELRQRTGTERMTYLGLDLLVPEQVFPPTPMSPLLGNAVLSEVRATDRVLDMGTGCGVNAILAASTSRDVVGVDNNPHAVESAARNAARAGVSTRTRFFRSDVFDAVEGTFDLIIVDPPFRWFPARDLIEASITDEGYRVLTRFVTQARSYLNRNGRVLVFFGSSGDLDYLRFLIDGVGFDREVVAAHQLTRGDLPVGYYTFRLTT